MVKKLPKLWDAFDLSPPLRNYLEEKMRNCRKCGLPLAFKKNERGKWYPTNLDGSEHWDLCRDQQFKLGKRKPEMRTSGWITGVNYKKPKIDCACPPWRYCRHNRRPRKSSVRNKLVTAHDYDNNIKHLKSIIEE